MEVVRWKVKTCVGYRAYIIRGNERVKDLSTLFLLIRPWITLCSMVKWIELNLVCQMGSNYIFPNDVIWKNYLTSLNFYVLILQNRYIRDYIVDQYEESSWNRVCYVKYILPHSGIKVRVYILNLRCVCVCVWRGGWL